MPFLGPIVVGCVSLGVAVVLIAVVLVKLVLDMLPGGNASAQHRTEYLATESTRHTSSAVDWPCA